MLPGHRVRRRREQRAREFELAYLFLLCAISYAIDFSMVLICATDPPAEAGFCFVTIPDRAPNRGWQRDLTQPLAIYEKLSLGLKIQAGSPAAFADLSSKPRSAPLNTNRRKAKGPFPKGSRTLLSPASPWSLYATAA